VPAGDAEVEHLSQQAGGLPVLVGWIIGIADPAGRDLPELQVQSRGLTAGGGKNRDILPRFIGELRVDLLRAALALSAGHLDCKFQGGDVSVSHHLLSPSSRTRIRDAVGAKRFSLPLPAARVGGASRVTPSPVLPSPESRSTD
jgi:hypothetical protein